MFSGYAKKVVYDERRWGILKKKRLKAIRIIEDLSSCRIIDVVVHGSVARGDVDEDSDIDIALLNPYSPSLLELCLEKRGYSIHSRKIVMPTPIHTPKLYIYLDPFEELVISNPIVSLKPLEVEFYKFSGMLEYKDLLNNTRIAGVNKNLLLIEPIEEGHLEIPVIGNEGYVAKRLGISINVVLDRVETLTRRAREGHSGLFIDYEIPLNTDVESYIKFLCNKNQFFRERLKQYGLCT
ncbi:nucleotidyltransferase domain-containing protein [Ignisphaera sp. 4213-co]|uniref:Nucleotidyltransferase domain-containing protein n=1 Tax=Ignisphaera cupida TaxID=3050454 RepID=A0ABD4Z3V2_9CREN|nr:nucleotidyltransferase domain-containing protein [Ignisphaera sp. 4213-co]MDK6028001.1 nucleotidyltransferase domain-containing protein [Ignisphaera sp. 4213-co]